MSYFYIPAYWITVGAFDWKIRIYILESGFWILQSNAKSENGFHLREIRPRDGFQLRNPNPDFMDFLFTVRLRNPKKDLQNRSREQRSSFYVLCVRVQDRCS